MKFNQKLFQKILILLGILSPIAIALRLYIYWKEIEVSSGFFVGKAIGCTSYNAVGFFVFGICLILAFFAKKIAPEKEIKEEEFFLPEEDSLLMQDEEETVSEERFPEFFLHGFAKKAASWNGTLSAFASILPGFGFLSHALSLFVYSKANISPYTLLFAFLSLLSGVFFLLFAFSNSTLQRKPMAFFALVPAFWCAVRMVVEYRDIARFVNKSLYIGQFLFVISLLVFFLYQAQTLLGEENYFSPNFYAFSGASAVFFGITARLPQLLAVMGEKISMDLVDSSTLIMDLAITLFVITKITHITKGPQN